MKVEMRKRWHAVIDEVNVVLITFMVVGVHWSGMVKVRTWYGYDDMHDKRNERYESVNVVMGGFPKTMDGAWKAARNYVSKWDERRWLLWAARRRKQDGFEADTSMMEGLTPFSKTGFPIKHG